MCQQIDNRMVLIKSEHILLKMHRTTDDESFCITEPSCMLHLPDGTADCHDIEVTRFQKPDDSILFVALRKILHRIIFRSQKRYQTVHAATEQTSLHLHFLYLLRAQKRM